MFLDVRTLRAWRRRLSSFADTACIMDAVARAYRKLKKRAERQDATRLRIVEATIELHRTIGPTATTVSRDRGARRRRPGDRLPPLPGRAHAVSWPAAVFTWSGTRCPSLAAWLAISGSRPSACASALAEVYAYHRANEAMFAHVLADARDHAVMGPYHAHWQRAADVLVAPVASCGVARRKLLRAAISLALSFDTWRTLTRDHGLSDPQAVDVALRLARES